MPIKFFPFQAEDYRTIIDRFYCRSLVAWSPGTGKTVLSLKLIEDKVKGTTIIVCPAGAKEHWRRETVRHLNRRAIVLSGMKPLKGLAAGRSIYVINYDILGLPHANAKTWTETLKALRPELVVYDESHFLKERTSKRSRACKELARGVPKILMLSGTPMPSRPIELWFPLSILKPELFPSVLDYAMEFCAARKRFGYWDFSGASNLPVLHNVLRNEVMCRRRKEDVLDQLPPLTTTVETFDIPPKARTEYDFAVREFLTWLAAKDKARARRAIGNEEITKLGYLKQLAAMSKLPLVVDWVRDFLAGDQKLIVFCIHHQFVDGLYAEFKDCSVVVTGDTPMRLRQPTFDRFNDDPKCRLLIGNIQAAGTFWSCRSASTVAFGELDWVPGNHAQAIDRVRGIQRGTGAPVTSYYLVASATIEEKLCEVLERKTDILDAAIDGKRTGSLKLFSLLIDELKKAGKSPKVRAKQEKPSPIPKKVGVTKWPPKKSAKKGTTKSLYSRRKRSPWPPHR